MLLTQFDEEKYIAMERADAREEGIAQINKLYAYLLQEGKREELERAIADEDFRQELFRRYDIK